MSAKLATEKPLSEVDQEHRSAGLPKITRRSWTWKYQNGFYSKRDSNQGQPRSSMGCAPWRRCPAHPASGTSL